MKFFKNIFAVSGDKNTISDDGSGPLVTYESGFPAPYSLAKTDPSAKFVERGDMNALLNAVTESLRIWQTGTYPEFIESTQNDGAQFPYGIGSIVKRGGITYVSTASSNTTIPAAIGASWVPLDLRKPDVEYVKLLAGTTTLTQTATGTYAYNIADFVGSGLNTNEIRGLHISATCANTNASSYVTATMPDGTTVEICRGRGGGSGDSTEVSTLSVIPINKSQASSGSITLVVNKGTDSATFTIRGATQRTLIF